MLSLSNHKNRDEDPSFSYQLAMASENVKLFNFWPSMFGMRVHYALDLKRIPYDLQEEDLSSKSEELLKLNPIYKKIPVLLHNGKSISESLIIVDYIDNVWSDVHKLLPDDPYDKAVARFWADFGDKKMYEAGFRIIRSTNKEDLEKAVEDMKSNFKTLDEALAEVGGGKAFFGGDKMNFADVGFAPFVCWFKAYETIGGFKFPGPEECPHMHKWMAALEKEEAVKKSTPSQDRVVEFVHSLRKRLGITS